ncbi:hypothetical protein [Bacillus pinisoli]|uniref:hypothetical protein n=1 Tax=Bacillus pinisoli TaxID=2901866 RepID=UPI001FF5AE8E|nr:hypothetical protein [Bacillus pinisoli]
MELIINDVKNYEPLSGEYIITKDECCYLIRDGKTTGPTAYVQWGTTIDRGKLYMAYQESSLKGLVIKLNNEHPIKMVIRGRWKVTFIVLKCMLLGLPTLD